MKYKPACEREVTNPIVLPETVPPKKDRINRTYAVDNYRDQKEMPVSEPGRHVHKTKALCDYFKENAGRGWAKPILPLAQAIETIGVNRNRFEIGPE